jgi:hypothetical protein
MTERELGLLDAAPMVPCHPNTLVRAIKRGDLKATKKLGKWWIETSELARFLDVVARPSPSPRSSSGERVG